jgi:molybdopterin-binding protein
VDSWGNAPICELASGAVPTYSIGQAAELLGVSPDTVRRWVDKGRLPATTGAGGRRSIDGTALARFAQSSAEAPPSEGLGPSSARNRFVGLVTAVVKDSVMAQVDLVCGAHRVVSLMSAEAADELGLAPGILAVATVKATNVTVELPRP